MKTFVWYSLAALGEIAGCFTFWMWLREGKSVGWIVPGMLSLSAFAFALTRVETAFASRAFAAYGGIYILTSLLWGWRVEGATPDRFDVWGATICLGGAAVIVFAPHH